MNEKLGQEPAFPRLEFIEQGNCNIFKELISKRFYAACAVKDDFLELPIYVQDYIVGRPNPNFLDDKKLSSIDKSKLYIEWLSEGRSKWRYIQADELLKQENE